jgi:hypothetical protein
MIVFDDVHWTYGGSGGSRQATDGVNHQELSEEELTTPQIREVAELLVMQHPDYGSFAFTDSDWFIARKRPAVGALPRTVSYQFVATPGDYVRKALLQMRRRLSARASR